MHHPDLRGRPCEDFHWASPEVVREAAITQGSHLVRLRREEGFTIAPKSTLTASSHSLAFEIQAGLRAAGIEVQVADGAKDVGVDFGAGSRRRVTLQRSRLVKVKAGTKAVLKMNGTVKQSRKLGASFGVQRSVPT